jgi:AraC-like DNA-binding protein
MPSRRKRPNHLGDIDVTYAAVMRRVLERRGLSAAALFTQFDLSPARLAIPQARISIPRFMRLGHAATELAGDPALGLSMGRETRITDMGMAGLAALAAPTLGDALATLIHFERLTSYNSRGHSRFMALPETRVAEFYSISPYNAFNYFVVDAVLSRWANFIGTLDAEARPLREVHIEYPPRGVETVFEDFFGCPVLFGAERNALILDRRALARPNPLAQPALFKSLYDHCEKELERLRSGWTLVDRVKEELAPRLRQSAPSLAIIAEAMGTTPWTLRRALAAQDKTFRQLIGETRQELAQEYVRDTRLSFAEIAFLLGFSSPAPFHRAFRRWTGTSAGQYRRDRRGDAT